MKFKVGNRTYTFIQAVYKDYSEITEITDDIAIVGFDIFGKVHEFWKSNVEFL